MRDAEVAVPEDPWRTPDPGAPRQPPPRPGYPPEYAPPPGAGYGPPPAPERPGGAGYGPPPAGYPGYGAPVGDPQPGPFNPYAAPPARRGSITRLVWFLSVLGLLVLGGCGIGIYWLVSTLGDNAKAVNAFLSDVRARDFDAAYDRLCPAQRSAQPRAEFSAALGRAVARNHAVSSYDINSVNTRSTNGVTLRTAGGEVRFSDGSESSITFTLGRSGGRLCVSSGFEQLT